MSDVARNIDEIRDYLLGRLSDEEALVFQDRLARDPSLVRELEQSVRMRAALRQLQAEGHFTARAPKPQAFRSGRMLQWLLPAAAAAVIAAVSINIWWDRTSVLTAAAPAGATRDGAPVIAAHFSFISTRGGSLPRLSLPSGGYVEFQAAPETLIARSYRLTLIRHEAQGEERVGSVAGVMVGHDGFLHAFAGASHLTPGNYSLRIEAEGGSPAEAKDYFFALQSPAASSTQ